ncbi:MAG: hypothetical protein ABW252_05355 [Polyangiales bacterium]
MRFIECPKKVWGELCADLTLVSIDGAHAGEERADGGRPDSKVAARQRGERCLACLDWRCQVLGASSRVNKV